jgi:hypothetical protein
MRSVAAPGELVHVNASLLQQRSSALDGPR